jgi:hypothetical protein
MTTPSDFRYPQPNAPDPRRSTIGWWGIGSVVSSAVAALFLPAALISGPGWAMQIWDAGPIWVVCCCIGVITGIRGMQKQRFASKLQRRIAFFGTLFSLLIFVVFTMIALMAGT